MSMQSWVETIYTQGSGTTLVSSSSEALLVSDVNIPAGYMYPGRILKIQVAGKASNQATPGNITFRLRWGGISGTVLGSSAFTQAAGALTDQTWYATIFVQCLTAGATGTFLTWGHFQRGNCAVAAVGDIKPDLFPISSLAAVTVDTTTAKALSFTGQFATSSATNSITAMGYVLTAEN